MNSYYAVVTLFSHDLWGYVYLVIIFVCDDPDLLKKSYDLLLQW